MNSQDLPSLARIYSAHEGISHWAASYRAVRKGDMFHRLESGHDCTVATYARIMQWFSDQWPADLPWPSDIPRPAPSPSVTQPSVYRNGSPEPAPADIMESVTRALDAGDEGAAIACAMALGADGLIASPNVLCQALRVQRYVYDQVVKRYVDGRPGERKLPRRLRDGKKSPSQRMLLALVAAGDERFKSRRQGAALIQTP